MNIDSQEFQNQKFQDDLWVTAICLRIEDMLTTHIEIDADSLSLLVSAVRTGLKSDNQLLNRFKSGNSFIEEDFFSDSETDQDTDTRNTSASYSGRYNHYWYTSFKHGK
jgi:hypothetical protein